MNLKHIIERIKLQKSLAMSLEESYKNKEKGSIYIQRKQILDRAIKQYQKKLTNLTQGTIITYQVKFKTGGKNISYKISYPASLKIEEIIFIQEILITSEWGSFSKLKVKEITTKHWGLIKNLKTL